MGHTADSVADRHRYADPMPYRATCRVSPWALAMGTAAALSLVACASGAGRTPGAEEQSPTSASTPDSAAPSASRSDQPNPAPSESADEQGSSSPAVLPSGASGRSLRLADVFAVNGDWQDSRYGVAGASEVPGIGATLSGCGDTSSADLELRLGNRFDRLTMKVGQADTSATSDATMDAVVVVNGEQQDARHVPFDRIQPISVDVRNGNAVKLRFWQDTAKCVSGAITVVIQDLTVT
jgi:hypothetical protein